MSTALVTSLRQSVLAGALAWPELGDFDGQSLDSSSLRISAGSHCSDGEIFLVGEWPVKALLRH